MDGTDALKDGVVYEKTAHARSDGNWHYYIKARSEDGEELLHGNVEDWLDNSVFCEMIDEMGKRCNTNLQVSLGSNAYKKVI